MKFHITKKEIQALLDWYQKEKRDLPWRHTTDPYRIWISEIMLQQTRVEKVKKYYERFILELPTIEDLAKVKEDHLLKLWEGLGYYSRARNLKKCALEIVQKNLKTFPETKEELMKLPGIGLYTAGAILSIAYHKCIPAIDGNVLRILSRIEEDPRDLLNEKVKNEYLIHLEKLMEPSYARDFTEAFIELGALVCLPNGTPVCQKCPFQQICQSFQNQTMLKYPHKKVKNARRKEEKTIYVLEYNEKYCIQKRKKSGLLSGLYELPNVDSFMTKEMLNTFLQTKKEQIEKIQELGKFHHVFSHIEWEMTVYLVHLKSPNHHKFYSKKEIETTYSLPTAFQKIFIKLK